MDRFKFANSIIYNHVDVIVNKIARIFFYAKPVIAGNVVEFSYAGKSFRIIVEEKNNEQ